MNMLEDAIQKAMIVQASQREAEVIQLIAAFPGLEWQIVQRETSHEVLFYRAWRQDRSTWLHVRFSPDGTRWAACPVAEEFEGDPASVAKVISKLDLELAVNTP